MELTELTIVRDPAVTARLAELDQFATSQALHRGELDGQLEVIQDRLRQTPEAKRVVREARRAVPGGKGRRGLQYQAELTALVGLYRQNPAWASLTAERDTCANEVDRLTVEHELLQADSIRAENDTFKAALATYPWWQLERELKRRNIAFDNRRMCVPRESYEQESEAFGRVLEHQYEQQKQRAATDNSGVTPDMVARWRSAVDKPLRPWKAPTLRQELQLWGFDSTALTARPQDCQWVIRQQAAPDPHDREAWNFCYENTDAGLSRFKQFLNVVPEFGLSPVFTIRDGRLVFDGIGHYEFAASGLGLVIPPECRTGDRMLVDAAAIRCMKQCRKPLLVEKFSEKT